MWLIWELFKYNWEVHFLDFFSFVTEYRLVQLHTTVKLGFKELLNKEQIGNSEPFPVTNLPVYLINSEQIVIK